MKVENLNVTCLLSANDAVLIAPSESELQTLIPTLIEGCENNVLSLNTRKAKALISLSSDIERN